MFYELTAKMEKKYKTASEAFLNQLRTELEGLHDEDGTQNAIKVAFI